MDESITPEDDGDATGLTRWHTVSAGARLAVAMAAGLAAGVAATAAGYRLGPLIGWDTAAAVFLVWVWSTIWHRDPEQTAGLATREDPSRPVSDAVLLGAAVVSLGAVGVVLLGSQGSSTADLALVFCSVALSWATVHSLFCLKYARLYYTDPVGGLDFNQDQDPAYTDFAYVAFTLGMTYQVSDTAIRTAVLRRTALQHALYSFLFGTVILSVTINLVVTFSR